jgi:two-component system, OmpR family, sensor histidine kinase KdpD
MTDAHPKPDELLQQLREEAQVRKRGWLKVFFGYAAGVGKTFSMLEAARAQREIGTDVVLGYVEPHARPETEALTLGMEALAPKSIEYRSIRLKEFDLDAALARKPAVLVVDELAHTNAPGCRYAKRWQDVQELLEAGINVYTTLNVQHVESLNDVVTQISGIQVQETIPDSVFDQADLIELIDLPPEELLQRFAEGKVYVPAQAQLAAQNFFKLPNLIALRELSLRRMAERVNVQVETAREETAGTRIWATRERFLVCVGPSPTSARLIRVTKRMAAAVRAPWIATYVDTGTTLSDVARQKLTRNLNLAERLGAETVTLGGQDVAEEIVKYARARNVTRIIIGKTGEAAWREALGRSVLSRILHQSGDTDVYVIRGKEEPVEAGTGQPQGVAPGSADYKSFAKAAVVWAICTLIALLFFKLGLAETNRVMVYFLGVALVASRYGWRPAICVSFLSVLAFDFFMVPPYFTFAVNDTQYVITFAVMLVISILISDLTHRIHMQAQASRQREQRTEVLYRLSRKLAETVGTHQLAVAAEAELVASFAGEAAVLLPDDQGKLKTTVAGPTGWTANQRELAVAQWTFEHSKLAGVGTDTLPDAHALYIPLAGSKGAVGVLAMRPLGADHFDSPDQRQLLETLASQIALALERDRLAEQAQKLVVQAEATIRSAAKPQSS